ncbi:MAG TPA: biotin--[acetyl-CoA-carboxylase] ligase [Thermoleophilaceae bacterium]|nr:biotin--[acetyl-CoA-carboxylase] ligase [Thermoleophilaceae bacterium]
MTLGRPHVHHRSTDSTNERARALASAGAPHGTLVTAAEQSAGRGRQGRTWVAPPGSALLASLVVRDLGERTLLLPLAAAVAVAEACEELASVECAIKWPNDVWIDGRKLAGILVEGRPQEGWAVLGMGVNTRTEEFPEELRETATSLALAAPETGPVEPGALLAPLLRALERLLAGDPEEILAAWRGRDALAGSPVRWRDGEGTAEGISDDGALLVRTESGVVELDAGEVHLLR